MEIGERGGVSKQQGTQYWWAYPLVIINWDTIFFFSAGGRLSTCERLWLPSFFPHLLTQPRRRGLAEKSLKSEFALWILPFRLIFPNVGAFFLRKILSVRIQNIRGRFISYEQNCSPVRGQTRTLPSVTTFASVIFFFSGDIDPRNEH